MGASGLTDNDPVVADKSLNAKSMRVTRYWDAATSIEPTVLLDPQEFGAAPHVGMR